MGQVLEEILVIVTVKVTLLIVKEIAVEPTSLMSVVYVMDLAYQKVHVIVKVKLLIVQVYVVETLHMMNVENVEDLESQTDTVIVSNII